MSILTSPRYPSAYWPGQSWPSCSALRDDPSVDAAAMRAMHADPHQPDWRVRLATPTSATGDPVVEWLTAPIVGGVVTMDHDGWPRSRATIDIAPAGPWTPGDDFTTPTTPTLSTTAGQPLAITPYGTIAEVWVGYVVDASVGELWSVRVFAGVVIAAAVQQPLGAAWTLECLDMSALLDSVAMPDSSASTVDALLHPEGTWSGQVTDDEYSIGAAVTGACRTATIGWWPVGDDVAWDSPGQLEVDDHTGDAASEWVDRDTEIGGRSLWSLVEDWMDAAGWECFDDPGAGGVLVIREPPTLDSEVTPSAAIAPGPGGNLLAIETALARVTNEVALTLWQDTDPVTEVTGWAEPPGGDDTATSVTRQGRVTHTARRRVSKALDLTEDVANGRAARLARRTTGFTREHTLRVIPMPWLTPGDRVTVTPLGGDTEDHLVRSVTLPIGPDPSGATIRTVSDRATYTGWGEGMLSSVVAEDIATSVWLDPDGFDLALLTGEPTPTDGAWDVDDLPALEPDAGDGYVRLAVEVAQLTGPVGHDPVEVVSAVDLDFAVHDAGPDPWPISHIAVVRSGQVLSIVALASQVDVHVGQQFTLPAGDLRFPVGSA